MEEYVIIFVVAVLLISASLCWTSERKKKEAEWYWEKAKVIRRHQEERYKRWCKEKDNRDWMMDILGKIEAMTREHLGGPEGNENEMDMDKLPEAVEAIYRKAEETYRKMEEEGKEAADVVQFVNDLKQTISNAAGEDIPLGHMAGKIMEMARGNDIMKEENAILRGQLEYINETEPDQKEAEEYAERLSELLKGNIQYSEQTETAIREAARMMRRRGNVDVDYQ